jgi:hypothetical protein
MNFLSQKGMVWPKGRVEAIILFGEKGWKVTAWYLKEPGRTYQAASGADVLDEESAKKKLDEVFGEWIQKEARRK